MRKLRIFPQNPPYHIDMIRRVLLEGEKMRKYEKKTLRLAIALSPREKSLARQLAKGGASAR